MIPVFRKSDFVYSLFVLSVLNINLAYAQVGVTLAGFDGIAGETIEVAIELTNVESSTGFSSFSFTIILDTPEVVFLGHDKAGTLSATTGWSVNSSTTTNKVGGFSSSSNAIGVSGTLIILRFRLDSIAGGAAVLLDKFTLTLSGVPLVYSPVQPAASIAAQNGNPSATPTSVETDEDNSVIIVLDGSDPENDPITFSITRDPDHGSVDLAGSTATYDPVENYFGTDSFEFVTSDGQSDSSPATVTITVRPINDPPTPSSLIEPSNGASIPVAGDPASSVVFSWESSADPDNDPLEYGWQLSETATFAGVILSVDAGGSTQIDLTIDELAAFLSSQGITVGQSFTAHHRVIVSDGTENVAGDSYGITFERGLITDTEKNENIPNQLEIGSLFPNPAANRLTVRYGLPVSRPATIKLFDLLGREVRRIASSSAQTGYHYVRLDVSNLPAGIYQVLLEQDGLSHTESLVVRR